MNKQSCSEGEVETLPAHLQFEHGNCAGTIYAHRIGGRIVEAYRGYGYGYMPVAQALRTELGSRSKR